MGGGAMLALGIYPVQWATLAFGGGMPDRILAAGRVSSAGVDVLGSAILAWDGDKETDSGGIASLNFGFQGNTRETTEITCEKGSLLIDTPAHAPTRLKIVDRTGNPYARPGSDEAPTELFETSLSDLPYHKWRDPRPALSYPHGEAMMYEARHVEECLQKGLRESPLYPLSETLIVAEIMEECLRQIGTR